MGTSIETFDSRTGSIGLSGNSWQREFQVTLLSTESIDNTNFATDPASHGLPIVGSFSYPNNAGVMVTDIQTVSRLGDRVWLVRVNYNYPNFIPGQQTSWVFSLQAGLGSKQIISSVSEDGTKSIDIGSFDYREVKNNQSTFSTAPLANGNVIHLEKQGDFRKADGFTVTIPSATLRLQKIFITEPNGFVIIDNLNRLNISHFHGAPPEHLKFAGGDIDRFAIGAGPGAVGNDASGLVFNWSVRLFFEWNPEGHQPQITHTYEKSGARTVVLEKSRNDPNELVPVIEKFLHYGLTDFESMLSSI